MNENNNTSLTFIIRKSKFATFKFLASGIAFTVIAFSGFLGGYWPFFVGLIGVMSLLCYTEASYGETEISETGVKYCIKYGTVFSFWNSSMSPVKSMVIDGTTATLKGDGRKAIMLTKLSNEDIRRLQGMYERYWSKNKSNEVKN